MALEQGQLGGHAWPIQDVGREGGGMEAMHLCCSGYHCGLGQGGQRRTVTPPSGLLLKYESKYINTLKSVRLNHNVGRVVCKEKTLEQRRGKQSWGWWLLPTILPKVKLKQDISSLRLAWATQ